MLILYDKLHYYVNTKNKANLQYTDQLFFIEKRGRFAPGAVLNGSDITILWNITYRAEYTKYSVGGELEKLSNHDINSITVCLASPDSVHYYTSPKKAKKALNLWLSDLVEWALGYHTLVQAKNSEINNAGMQLMYTVHRS